MLLIYCYPLHLQKYNIILGGVHCCPLQNEWRSIRIIEECPVHTANPVLTPFAHPPHPPISRPQHDWGVCVGAGSILTITPVEPGILVSRDFRFIKYHIARLLGCWHGFAKAEKLWFLASQYLLYFSYRFSSGEAGCHSRVFLRVAFYGQVTFGTCSWLVFIDVGRIPSLLPHRAAAVWSRALKGTGSRCWPAGHPQEASFQISPWAFLNLGFLTCVGGWSGT